MPEPEPNLTEYGKPVRPAPVEKIDSNPVPLSKHNDGAVVYTGEDMTGKLDHTVIDTIVSAYKTEGDFIALLRSAPRYPGPLQEKGIEGFVRLKYTINEMGATENIMVVESSHRGFERDAVRAIDKFKFKPRIIYGQPQVVHKVYSRLDFKLEG